MASEDEVALKDDRARKLEAIASYYYYSDLSAEAIACQVDMDLDEVQKAMDDLAKEEALKLLADQATTRIESIMTPEVVCLESYKTALDAAVIMRDKEVSSVVVTKNNDPFGIVTERDIVRKVGAKGIPLKDVKLEELASRPLIAVESGLTVEEAADLMTRSKIHKLPVTSAHRLVGMVTITDLAAFLSPSRRPGLALSVLQAMSRGRTD